ncbi:MAG: DUF1343 domain-containing protein [Hydrogenophilus sp.]|nr:DUF1343 domain-containing protein [Hydrogenophilus sp.]
MMVKIGLDRLLTEEQWQRPLAGRRVMVLTHPAAVTGPAAPCGPLVHAADALAAFLPTVGGKLTALFGPQHGARGDKQDNMVFSTDEWDERLRVPVFSLYGPRLRPEAAQLALGDLLLVDLQDVGCRVYTYLTTLREVLIAAASASLPVWVLDRPNPVGRWVEGLRVERGWESFVAAVPWPMRHGMTLGEAARWMAAQLGGEVDLTVIPVSGWRPSEGPGFGWPTTHVWVPPSPNAPTLWMARCYPGTVLLEGTTLSEGRGTSRPLECFGAPWLDPYRLLMEMRRAAPEWLEGCALRPVAFEPTFHKYTGVRCYGLMVHTEPPVFDPRRFRPWRLMALALKVIHSLYPDQPLWRAFVYEFEKERLAFDCIAGGPRLREWVEDPAASWSDLEALATEEERRWQEEQLPFRLGEE